MSWRIPHLLFGCLLLMSSLSPHDTWGSTRLDSLREIVSSSVHQPLERIDAALSLCRTLYSSDPQESRQRAHFAIQASRTQQDSYREGVAWCFLAIGYSIQSQFDSAGQCLEQAESLGLTHGHEEILAKAYLNRGIIAFRNGQHAEAISFYRCTQEKLADMGDSLRMSSVYNNLGNVYQEMGHFDKAISMFERSIAIKDSLGKTEHLPVNMINLGMLFFQQERYNQAFAYLEEARARYQNQHDKIGLMSLYFNFGSVYNALGDYQHALRYYWAGIDLQEQTGLKLANGRMLCDLGIIEYELGERELGMFRIERAICIQEELGDSVGLANSYFHLAELFLETGDNAAARKYAELALRIAQRGTFWEAQLHAHHTLGQLAASKGEWQIAWAHTNQVDSICHAQELHGYMEHVYSLRAEIHAGRGDYQNAYRNQRLSSSLGDSLERVRIHKATVRRELDAFYQRKEAALRAQQTQQQIVHQQELTNARWSQYMLCVGIFLMVILVIWVYSGYLQKQRHNQLLHNRQMELARKNQDLLRLDEERSQLIGVFTHDLRNPVAQIQSLNTLLGDLMPTQDPVALRMRQGIQSAAGRLSQIIDRILALKSMENQGLNLQPVVLNPACVLTEVVAGLQATAQQKELVLLTDQLSKAPHIWVDPEMLQEVMENLIGNALKFSPPRREVHVGMQVEEGDLQLYVQDQGMGIHPDDMPRLFGKFQKLRTRPTGDESSTGLGLAIVKQLVEEMDGEVWCESVWGEGATFYVRFPLVHQA